MNLLIHYTDLFIQATLNASIIIGLCGIVFMLAERLRPHKNTSVFGKDFTKELWLALLNGSFFAPFFTILFTFVTLHVVNIGLPHQLFAEKILMWPLLLQILIGAFIMDFSTYWRHRLMHNRNLWPFHSMHHSAEELTWLTALRLHPLEILISKIFDVTLLHVLGFSEADIVGAVIFMMIYNFFTHANINLEFRAPLKYIFASPNFHRWHHANHKEAYDKNFCATFSLLDVMFGTYYFPQGTVPDIYGLSPAEQREVPHSLRSHLLLPFQKTWARFKKN
jgi:sterol desaturase/sphingolipid hydroxylase (fatty acid hydroxylase superfamily)